MAVIEIFFGHNPFGLRPKQGHQPTYLRPKSDSVQKRDILTVNLTLPLFHPLKVLQK